MLDPSSEEESSDEAPDGEEQELLGIFKGSESTGLASPNASPHGSTLSLHNKTPSPTPSLKSNVALAKEKEDEERKEKLQLYVFVLRCIAYPFNARQPTDMVRRHTRVSKQNLLQIRERFRAFINGETKIASDEAFHNSVCAFDEGFIRSDRIFKMVMSGGCSANDFREVFKNMIERRVRNLPEISGLSKETVLSSWMAKFDAIYRGEEDLRKGSRIAASAASELILSKEQLYEMFQTILGVKRYEHQILYNACQLDNPDEQAACIRRELQGRVKAVVTQRKCLPAFMHKNMESLYVEEQQTAINQLMGNLESLPVTKGTTESKFPLYRLAKVPNTISMVEVADDADPTLSKTDVVLSFMIEIVVAEARGLKSLQGKKLVYCTMEVEGGGEKLQTQNEPAAKPIWGTRADFTTCHPRPVIKVKLFLENTGVLALDDKELGRVIIKPSPGGADAFEWHEMSTSKGWSGEKIKLKISAKMDKPVNLKKCGYIFARGKTVWKKWKKRFLVIVQVSQYTFAVCSYGEKKTEPSEMMQLDGYTVDYCEPLADEDHKDGRFFFKAVKEGDQVVFATDEELERQIWVNKLYTATGQSHKPVAPKLSVSSAPSQSNSLTRWQGDADRARKLGLDELIQADPCIFDHLRLFEMLQRLTLTHRLNDSYSCLGWFSPGQLFVLDEYCFRYGVRGCHRHLCYLSDLLDRAETGIMIDPTLLHYSFAFCASHVHGNRPDGVGTITVEEKSKFEEIKDRLWNMLSTQITQFRYSFPFGRPEGALKATLSLFERVMMKDISTPVPPQEFRAEIRQCLQKAALVNYTRVSAYAKIEERSGPFRFEYNALFSLESAEIDVPPSKRLDDIMHLAELCIELLQQNDEHHAEALAWVSDLMIEHQELFWSLFSVDMQVALKLQPVDSWDSFQLFQLLNEYLRNDSSMNLGKFHDHLKEVFAPLVIRYIDLMESSIAQSVHKGFAKERWVAVRDGCAASEDLFWKLTALQQFIGDLNWPDEVMADHLMSRLKLMAADMVQSCVDRTKQTFERWLKTTRFSVEFIISNANCVMLNVLTHAKKQSRVLCSKEKKNSENRYHTDVHCYLRQVINDVLSQLVTKLTSVLDSLLGKVARYDQGSLLAPVFSLKSPGTEMEDSFLKFVKSNLGRFRTQLNNAKLRAKLVKEWYISTVAKICDWLSERMNMALHHYQVQTLLAIITDLPQQFGEDNIAQKVLRSRTYQTVISRLQVEHSMITDGHVNMQLLEESPNPHEPDDEDDDDDVSQSSDDAA